MPTDYKKEWIEKSAIDYFSPFISLWLASIRGICRIILI